MKPRIQRRVLPSIAIFLFSFSLLWLLCIIVFRFCFLFFFCFIFKQSLGRPYRSVLISTPHLTSVSAYLLSIFTSRFNYIYFIIRIIFGLGSVKNSFGFIVVVVNLSLVSCACLLLLFQRLFG